MSEFWGLERKSNEANHTKSVIALLRGNSGQVARITYHLSRAMDNGLTKEQASDLLTHLAFYSGWPNAISALPIVKESL
jgi:alkylhydroperoxidase/carboxymuconolactone decarboxylase family protein YurZ